jgi:hypothetical protein
MCPWPEIRAFKLRRIRAVEKVTASPFHVTCQIFNHTPHEKAMKSESKNMLVYMPMVFPNFLKIGGI